MNQSIIKYLYGDYGDKEAPSGSSGRGETNPQNQLKQEAFSNNKDTQASEPLSAGKAPSTGGGLGEAGWPLWEVFIRSKQGLDHKHVGSLHAPDAQMAIENARDVYTRRNEGISIWVMESKHIHASNPDEAESFYDPANDKIYRHPTFYDLPDEVKHM
jgi:ring-1,2-phenylacetyl-CoA epoxidase subunit PaaB